MNANSTITFTNKFWNDDRKTFNKAEDIHKRKREIFSEYYDIVVK